LLTVGEIANDLAFYSWNIPHGHLNKLGGHFTVDSDIDVFHRIKVNFEGFPSKNEVFLRVWHEQVSIGIILP
jgi:hypothetical protein